VAAADLAAKFLNVAAVYVRRAFDDYSPLSIRNMLLMAKGSVIKVINPNISNRMGCAPK